MRKRQLRELAHHLGLAKALTPLPWPPLWNSIEIAEHKARTAATFRRASKFFENGIQVHNLNYLMTLDGIVASRGGIPLIEQGNLIGAMGCSGGTDSQDGVVCRADVAVIL